MLDPGVLNLTIYQGATFRKTLVWKTGSPAVPVDLTGVTMRMQIREKVSSQIPLVELTTENGGIQINSDPTTGSFEIFIDAEHTAALTVRSAVYDLEVIMSNNDVIRLLLGYITISQEVTR